MIEIIIYFLYRYETYVVIYESVNESINSASEKHLKGYYGLCLEKHLMR